MKEIRKTMYEQNENITEETEIIQRKFPTEILELKITITGIKNLL